MPLYFPINSFNAGELSPKMLSRPDVSQYSKGCRELKNFMVTPYGSVERRPGTVFVAPVKTSDPVKLIPFVYSSSIGYLCEFGANYVRIYRDDVLAAELGSPYEHGELENLRYVQSADVMFIAHPNAPIYELKRLDDAEFTLEAMDYAFPPMMDPNLSDITLTPSAREGNITLTASGPVFETGQLYFELVHTRIQNDIDKDFKADGVSESMEVYGYWSLTTHGTWTGTLKIQRSFDGGASWTDFRTYSSANDQNFSASGEETREDALYRLSMSDYANGTSGSIKYCQALLSNPDYQTNGVVRITGITSPTQAAATVIRKLGDTTPTKEWSEGAWSYLRGFPRSIAFFEERLMLGGTKTQPNTVWGSRINDWNNFKIGDLDDDGLSFTLASDTVNEICWMVQHDALVIGTVDSEWTLSASSSADALTPTNVRVKRQSVFGSAPIPARMVNDVVLFVQRRGRKIREFIFTWEKEGYVAPDLTILADHITESGVKDIQLQQQPDSVLWCLLHNGTIAALTYERDQEVVGWQRYVTDGEVASIAIIPQDAEDYIYLAVRRGGAFNLERLAPRSYGKIQDAVFCDAAKITEADGMTTVAGLEHLEGREVQILADGSIQIPKIVENGVIQLEYPAGKTVVGLSYESKLAPMPPELDLETGSSLLRRKTISEVRVRVYDTVGGEIRIGSSAWEQIFSRDVLEDDVNAPVQPKSEVKQKNLLSDYLYDQSVELRQNQPLPLNIGCLVMIYEVQE